MPNLSSRVGRISQRICLQKIHYAACEKFPAKAHHGDSASAAPNRTGRRHHHRPASGAPYGRTTPSLRRWNRPQVLDSKSVVSNPLRHSGLQRTGHRKPLIRSHFCIDVGEGVSCGSTLPEARGTATTSADRAARASRQPHSPSELPQARCPGTAHRCRSGRPG